jgi:hypothetical protein
MANLKTNISLSFVTQQYKFGDVAANTKNLSILIF